MTTADRGTAALVNAAGRRDGDDEQILATVDRYLARGLALKRWYDAALPGARFREVFDLTHTPHHPDSSYGFFDTVTLPEGPCPVIGCYQQMFYDRPGQMTDFNTRHRAEWLRQVREFVLHYFMRISTFTTPQTSIGGGYPPPGEYRSPLSWCRSDSEDPGGFGFTQLFYKLRETGQVFRFPPHEAFSIVDLRDIGTRYEWVVLKVRIYDFDVRLKPFGDNAPELMADLGEDSYLVITRDFILDQQNPEPGVIARYGFGYAFLHSITPKLEAYGPGEFYAAFKSIQFDVDPKGIMTVRMGFVANRPSGVVNLRVKPFVWSFRMADWLSFGWASRLLGPVRSSFEDVSLGTVDPVYAYIAAANAITANLAGDMLCVSREYLNKIILLQHLSQHYSSLQGSLITWRQIPNWMDTAALPSWVVTGGLVDDQP